MFRTMRRNGIVPMLMLLVMAGSIPLQVTALIHDDGRDPCEPTLVLHDESAHRYGPVHGRTPGPEHCAVCHWLQTLRNLQAAAGLALPVGESAAAQSAASAVVHSIVVARHAARAPPVL
jgi:hypothetical protein